MPLLLCCLDALSIIVIRIELILMAISHIWTSNSTDKRIAGVKKMFGKTLEEQSKTAITYYDFLLVAKKLNFRFEDSQHLMALRKYFFRNKNSVLVRRLVSLLLICEESLNEATFQSGFPDKLIVKFDVEAPEFEPIKEVTNEDEEARPEVESEANNGMEEDLESIEFKEKLAIILSMKTSEMINKIRLLLDSHPNIFTVIQSLSLKDVPYLLFKKAALVVIKNSQTDFKRERLAFSEEDIKAMFIILSGDGSQGIRHQQLALLRNEEHMTQRITGFYDGRINRKMVKATVIRMGKIASEVQLFQVKSASLIEFKSMEESIVEESGPPKMGSKMPHLGSVRGSGLKHSPSRRLGNIKTDRMQINKSSLDTYKRHEDTSLSREREKIEKLIRTSASDRKKKVGNETIASRLRKMFIHKVILPREKMLEEEKRKYGFKSQATNLLLKPF